MARPLFRLSDSHSLTQYHDVIKVLRTFNDDVAIAYQSNWYIIIACCSEYICHQVMLKLSRKQAWVMEHRPGRKVHDRWYIQLKFERE